MGITMKYKRNIWRKFVVLTNCECTTNIIDKLIVVSGNSIFQTYSSNINMVSIMIFGISEFTVCVSYIFSLESTNVDTFVLWLTIELQMRIQLLYLFTVINIVKIDVYKAQTFRILGSSHCISALLQMGLMSSLCWQVTLRMIPRAHLITCQR